MLLNKIYNARPSGSLLLTHHITYLRLPQAVLQDSIGKLTGLGGGGAGGE